MALTDPFPADVETWLRESIVHLFKATVLPVSGASFDLAVDDALDLTYDMDWSPFVQVSLTVKTPADPVQMAALDGRLATRLQLRMGYRWAGTDYWTTMATLRLHRADTPHPGGNTTLTAHGAEMRLQERGSLKEGPAAIDGTINRTGVEPFLRHWIERAWWTGTYPTIISTIPGGTWNSHLVSQYTHAGGSYWSAMEGVARAAGVRAYDDGSGTWHIDHLPGLGTDYAAKLRDGKRGTITSADSSVDRENWFNQVIVQWDWVSDTGTPNSLTGFARVSSGPYQTSVANTKEYRDYREGPVTSGYATAFAQGLLAKFMNRGKSRSFTAAAAYWLRPGMTILVKIGLAKYDRVLVSAVTFSPLTGSMAVRTIRPDDYETS